MKSDMWRVRAQLTNRAGMNSALSLAPIAKVKHAKQMPKFGVILNVRPPDAVVAEEQ